MTKRLADGKFRKGVSGNPLGRPKQGSTILRESLKEHGAAVAQTVVEQALAGDMAACKMILDRLVPPLKPTTQSVRIDLPSDAGIAGTAKAFVDAAATGRIPSDVAAQMVTALGAVAKIVEVDELTRRIEALEASDHAKAN